MRVAMSGASGLIGSALAADLTAAGVEVVALVRRPAATAGEITWNPLGSGLDPRALAGVDAVVHLSGAPVADRRWTPARKAELRDSRITSTRTLVTAILAAEPRPPVLLCGSAIGYYGDTGGQVADETAPPGTGFLADLVRDWEAATRPAADAGVRVVNLRSGIVLAREGGMLGPLTLPFKLGLGTQIGPGTQYLSWIALTDEVRAIRFLLDRSDLSGPVNLTAPNAATNAEFTRAFAQALRRPALLRLPAPVLRTALGEVSTELLSSSRIKPAKLLEAGFTFTYPDIGPALRSILQPA
jgi:uncharacterized protein (TIGR01777 family)